MEIRVNYWQIAIGAAVIVATVYSIFASAKQMASDPRRALLEGVVYWVAHNWVGVVGYPFLLLLGSVLIYNGFH